MGSVPLDGVLAYEEDDEERFAREAPSYDVGAAVARQQVTLARIECRRIGGEDTWIYAGETEPVDLYGRRRSVQVEVGGETVVHSWWRLEVLAPLAHRSWKHGMTITVAERPWSMCWCRRAVLRPKPGLRRAYVGLRSPEVRSRTGRRRPRTGATPMTRLAHPLACGVAPAWASAWGGNRYGVWAEFAVGGVARRLRWVPGGRFLRGGAAEVVP